jgi:hypothetical protein
LLSTDRSVPSPTVFHLARANIKEVQNILDSQGNPVINVTYSDVGVQASEVLSINTRNINEFAISSAEVSDKSVQTLFNRLEQGIQTIDNPENKITSVNEINLIDLSELPIEPPQVLPDVGVRVLEQLKTFNSSGILETWYPDGNHVIYYP